MRIYILESEFGEELSMQVWIGLKKRDEYVSEWTGEIVDEGEIGAAIEKALSDYRIFFFVGFNLIRSGS
jgi:hypothetical protein